MKGRQKFPVYPFLLALYPVLFLYSRNTHLVQPADCLKPALVAVGATTILMLIARWVLKSNLKTGIVVSIFVGLFFFYGHVVDMVLQTSPAFRVGLFLMPLWGLVLLGSMWLIGRTKHDLAGVASFLRLVAVLLLGMALLEAAVVRDREQALAEEQWSKFLARSIRGTKVLKVQHAGARPDIYFIVVDAYARSDVLKSEFNIDNSSFVRFLESKGFYVPAKSHCNYLWTTLSVPSMLNMNYLHFITKISGVRTTTAAGNYCITRWPRSVRLLRRVGYKLVVVPAHYEGLDPAGADFEPRSRWLELSEFDAILMRSTALRLLHTDPEVATCRSEARGFAYLDTVPEISGPKFVIAHLVATHPPFCFGADGSARTNILSEIETHRLSRKQYSRLYGDCINYTNLRLKSLITEILARSATDPIIIVQGDHGAVTPYRTRKGCVFAAYHLPDGGNELLHQRITPVNLFRIIFDRYFGTRYGLVPDVTYARESYTGPIRFKPVDAESFVINMRQEHATPPRF